MSNSQIEKARKLSQKSLWISGLLTLCIPFAGYIYTSRFRLAVIALIIWLPLISADEADETSSTLLGLLMIGTSIENVVAVVRAKNIHREMGQKDQQQQGTRKLQVELLKLTQQRGEVTLADCVIATQEEIDDVRTILLELERQDLIRSANRASDGAVVYRIV